VVCLVHERGLPTDIIGHDALPRVRTVRGDIRNKAQLESILKEHSIATLFHFAAKAIVKKANTDPAPTLETNIVGAIALLEACRRCPDVGQIIVASSDKAYGDAGEQAYTEDMPLRARHPYDVSKACSDMIVRSYANTFELPAVITRCGNFYGPGDLNWNRVVPGTVRSLCEGLRSVIRSDGKYVRDYFYVEDAAEAHIMLAEKLSDKPNLRGEAFNFSNESPVAVDELVEKIIALMGMRLRPEVRNETSNEIRHQALSAAKARNEFGWRPRFTLDEGLQLAVAWYRETLKAGPAGIARINDLQFQPSRGVSAFGDKADISDILFKARGEYDTGAINRSPVSIRTVTTVS
jgi:CDP-glucose 4,6-dehydratase